MKDNRLSKEVMFGMMEGKDKERKTMPKMVDNIKEWCKEEIHILDRKAQDRGMWRTVVKTALDTYGH